MCKALSWFIVFMIYLVTLICFLLLNIFCISYLWKEKSFSMKKLIIATITFSIWAIPLDIYLSSNGVWRFGNSIFNIMWFGMPIEEYLFYFTVIPFIFLYFKIIDLKIR